VAAPVTLFLILGLVFGLVPSVFVGAQRAGGSSPTPEATTDRVNRLRWWPTKGTLPLQAFAGAKACSECHSDVASTQLHTPMALASIKVEGPVLAEGQSSLSGTMKARTLQLGAYFYRISSDYRGSKLVASSGRQTIAADISWIMGAGVHGQTYILENMTGKKRNVYESEVSNFALHGMDVTPGHALVEAGNLKNALGERLSTSAAARCFGCHTTYSSTNSKFDVSRAVPGVHCEACHGPGVDHIEAIKTGQIEEAAKAILNPAVLNPVDSVDFCGACHRTAIDVVESEVSYGPMNVRFQPYRLEKSRCWGSRGDERLTCIACHNPHEVLIREASSYDRRCLSCHAPQGKSHPTGAAPICPKAGTNCTTCHMPKYDVPGMHAKFTDHFIRVVRADESYPN